MVLDPDDTVKESKEDNNVSALADVEITYGGNPPARQILSPYTIGIIKDALRYAGEASAEINSTYRTPEEQADEMLAIINGPGGIQEAKSLYSGKFGKQVIKVYEDARKNTTRTSLSTRRTLRSITNLRGSRLRHRSFQIIVRSWRRKSLRSWPLTRTLLLPTRASFLRWNTIDIRFAIVENQSLFHEALTGDSRISKVLDPFNSSDRAFHIEVRLI